MKTTGQEAEFRTLFAQEADGQLERISQHALDLEQGGDSAELVASLFRDAHTIKSTAGLVGLAGVGRVAHGLEDVFEQMRSGGRQATPEVIDAVLAAADTLRSLIPDLIAGEDRDQPLGAAEGALTVAIDNWNAQPQSPATATTTTTTFDSSIASPARPPAPREPAPVPEAPAPVATTVGATMAVPVERLDELVRLAGEAMAAQRGVEHAAAERGDDPDDAPEIVALAATVGGLQREVLQARMVAVGAVAAPLRRVVRDVARQTGKNVRWEIEGESTELDRQVLERLRDPLSHLVRNAVDHGIEVPDVRRTAGKSEQAVVRLSARQRGSEVELRVSDDGGGLSDGLGADAVFRPGFSTAAEVTELSGRGVGLDVVRTAVEGLRGRVEVSSQSGQGCCFILTVPLTLAVLPCLVAVVAGERFALPFHAVETVLEQPPEAEIAVEGRRELVVADRSVPIVSLGRILGLPTDAPRGPVLLVRGQNRRAGLRVDELAGRRDVLVKDLGPILGDLPLLVGASVEADGTVLLVLDADGLVEASGSAPNTRADGPAAGDAHPPAQTNPSRQQRILVVEDALTVRELQRSILQRAGYEVDTAVDGEEALNRLSQDSYDLVLTDVEMPRMDGFRLTRAIRAHPRLSGVPVVIVTSLARDEDRRKGLDSGADAYIVKSEFDEDALLGAVTRTLGPVK